jgi:GH24 family phage-related lysozyme (muramidase)
MTTEMILHHLENSGFRVLGSDGVFIWLEDPTCFVRSLEGFVDIAWIVITAFAGVLLFGWGVSLIRGAKGDIATNIRNLFLIFGILAASRPIVNMIWGDDLFARGCSVVQVPVEKVNEIISSAKLRLKSQTENALFEEIDIYDSAITSATPGILGEINTALPDTPLASSEIVSTGTGAGAIGVALRTDMSLTLNTSLAAHILGHEGYRTQVYLDTKYLPTIGIGGLVTDYSRFAAYDFYGNTGRLDDAQKREFYNKVMAFASAAKSRNDPMVRTLNNTIRTGLLSDGTRLADIRATPESIQVEMNKYLARSEAILSKAYKGWASYPQPAKNALLDIAYGYGVGGIHKIRGLDVCVNAQDWACAAEIAPRTSRQSKVGAQRQQWFLQAAGN